MTENFKDNSPEVSETNVVDPYIGHETLYKGLLAVAISSLLIVLYVWVRFRTISGPSAGVFSLLALLHDVIIYSVCGFRSDAFAIIANSLSAYGLIGTPLCLTALAMRHHVARTWAAAFASGVPPAIAPDTGRKTGRTEDV